MNDANTTPAISTDIAVAASTDTGVAADTMNCNKRPVQEVISLLSSSSDDETSDSDSSDSEVIITRSPAPVIPKAAPVPVVASRSMDMGRNAGARSVSVSVSANTASSASVVKNPYDKKKYVGGAEKARLDARKKQKSKGTKILRPEEKERLDSQVLPRKMNPFDRFFAALLRSSPQEFLEAQTVDSKAEALWEVICKRVNLTAPKSPIPAYVGDAQLHFNLRAALVLEEARNAISHPLAQNWKQRKGKIPSGTMTLTAHYLEQQQGQSSNLGHAKIIFCKQQPFTKDELFNIRPGTVFECLPRDAHRTIQNVILGVVGSSKREQIEKSRSFPLFIFRDTPHKVEDTDWIVSPINTLITELRQYEAMTCKLSSIAFLHSLLGNKGATHIRFDDIKPAAASRDEDDFEYSNVTQGAIEDYFPPIKVDVDAPSPMFKLPRLNPSQSKAASAFLDSPPNSITIIQGPPGTGKTTLLVSVICRYILNSGDHHRRLMVCAPTNKAVSVLASRFAASINQDTCNCNAIMVGDAEKLLMDERSRTGLADDSMQLSSMFIFRWMDAMMDDYRKIRNFFVGRKPQGWTSEDAWKSSRRLEKRLTNGLPGLPNDVVNKAASVTEALEKLAAGGAAHGIVENLEKLLKALKDVPPDNVWRELLHSADVVFCTLASAGGGIFKSCAEWDDLIVDDYHAHTRSHPIPLHTSNRYTEAAAATEPELCIPVQLGPKRALFVGDPLQLPATVMSRRAVKLGLARSLHERLMYECDFSYEMLNVQYRMNPAISAFPSSRFYKSKIANGENVSCPQYGNGDGLLQGRPYTFLQVDGVEEQGSGGSYKNTSEARTVVDMVARLQTIAQSNSGDRASWHSTDRIRIITFYQAQVGLIKRLLRDRGFGDKIVCATVDSSQGTEADVVIVSFVRSQVNSSSGGGKVDARYAAGFLTDDRRMNVAITRAKYQLVCVGNVRGLNRLVGTNAETLRLLAADAEERNVIQPYPSMRNDKNARPDLGQQAKRPKIE